MPTVGIPVSANLNRQRLTVYFRHVPAWLPVSCVKSDDDGNLRALGGPWPEDDQQWLLSADDARRFVEAGELELRLADSADQHVAARLGSFQPGRT